MRAGREADRVVSRAYGTSAVADAGVIAGLIAGCVEGRLSVDKLHPETPVHVTYMARKEQGKLKIYKPDTEEVRNARSRSQNVTSVKSFLFTTYTLAKNLGWVKSNASCNADGQEANRRLTP